jgi:hypothetical protein
MAVRGRAKASTTRDSVTEQTRWAVPGEQFGNVSTRFVYLVLVPAFGIRVAVPP